MTTRAQLKELIAVARGEKPADLVLKGGVVVNVFSGELMKTDVAVHQGRIAGLGEYEGAEVVDVSGSYILPGLIDSHVHPESAMLEPARFAREVAPLGTTCVVADPHEIANVLGEEGIAFMLERSEGLPVAFYFNVPSCVPATHMETAGAALGADAIAKFLAHPRVLGVAEMMNFPGVLMGFDEVMDKLLAGMAVLARVDGHAPGLSGKDLNAYLAAGISSDHEAFTANEAKEKLDRGMAIAIREGSAARNLADLLPVVTEKTWQRCMFCTDDRHALDLKQRGHLNSILAMAVGLGMDPVMAVRLATITPATHYGLKDRGAVAPGFVADLVVTPDLTHFCPSLVYTGGLRAAKDGHALFPTPDYGKPWPNKARVRPFAARDFRIGAQEDQGPVIGVVPGQIITRNLRLTLPNRGGEVVADTGADILKMAVVERYSGRSGHCVALVQGFGLKRGALATSVAHDSHNFLAVGCDDESLSRAINALATHGGGLVACDGDTTLTLPLEVAGLMSSLPGDEVRQRLSALLAMAKGMGCVLAEPFMQLAFLALPVIPSLKLTDRGLVDVERFQVITPYRPLA